MTFAIDINDVLRDFTRQFKKIYKQQINRKCDIQEEDIITNEYDLIFPFENINTYHDFLYSDHALELFGSCPILNSKILPEMLNNWLLETIPNIDSTEPIKVIVVSSKEFGLSIPQTLFFLSKLSIKVREFYFPTDSYTIWDKCDILITANPTLLESKPEGKISVKIETTYNKNCCSDYSFENSCDFFKNSELSENIVDKIQKNG